MFQASKGHRSHVDETRTVFRPGGFRGYYRFQGILQVSGDEKGLIEKRPKVIGHTAG